MTDSFTLLEAVHDRDSFIAFVRALAAERESTADIERSDPARYSLDGALGWANADIPAFLEAACEYFKSRPLDTEPSWRLFAEFLWCGKIIE